MPLDKGYYFKFNCTEVRLIKNTLEDNGFITQPFVTKQMSLTFQLINDGNQMVRKQGDEWLIYWSTKHIKYGVYSNLKKYQRVNQFPRSFEITRKDLLVERI